MTKILLSLLVLISSNAAVAATGSNNIYQFNWLDDDEVVYVLQNKEFPKDGRFGVDLYLMDSQSSTYQDTTALSLSFVYNFSETIAVDFTYKSYTNSDNADLENVLDLGGGNKTKPSIRMVDAASIVHVDWIPFYGKVNTFNHILYFDWGVGLGVGQFTTRTNYPTFKKDNVPLTYITESLTGFNFKTTFRFFTTDNINFGIQYDLAGFTAITDDSGTEALFMYNDLSFFLGYLF